MQRVDESANLARRTLLAMTALAAMAAAGMASAAESPTGAVELPPDLAKAVNAYDQATLRNDIATLGELVTDDYVLVNSDTSLQDKQSYLDDFRRPGFKVDPYVMEQPVHKVLGDAAVTGGVFRLGWTQDGMHQSRMLRVAHVWVRDNGRWRITYTQLTRVPE